MNSNKQSGMVSILTVIFFMIFVSLIVVGYMSIVSYDQRQTADADLSASALAAARSGIEEGKRILLYCEQNPSATGCTEVLGSTDCKTFSSTNAKTLATTVGVDIDSSGQGVIAGQSEYQQYFTCMIINRETPEVRGTVMKDSDYIVKLNTGSVSYNSLNVSWTADTGSFAHLTAAAIPSWTAENNWVVSGTTLPPVLRVQLIKVDGASSFSDGADPLSGIENKTRTLFITPCIGTATACSSLDRSITNDARAATAGDNRPGSTLPVVAANCASITSGYSCKTRITGLSASGGAYYYARVSLIYGTSAAVTLGPWDSSASPAPGSVNLVNVQPRIDVTGRANDVFRRVRAEVSHDIGGSYVKNALDSAAPICKDMLVTSDPASSKLNCN